MLLEQKVRGTAVWVPVPSMPDAGILTNAGVKPRNSTQYRARFIQGAQDYTSDAVRVKVPLTLSKNRIHKGNGIRIRAPRTG